MIDVERDLIVKQRHVEVTDGDIINGICTHKQMVFVRVVSNTVLVLDFEVYVKNRIEINGPRIFRIAVFRDKLYCTDSKTNKVLCYNTAGKRLWSYQQGLIWPLGIDEDRNGFVYVAYQTSNKIITLSQDGKELKVIMSAGSSVSFPFGINIDRGKSLLAFSNMLDKSFLLSI